MITSATCEIKRLYTILYFHVRYHIFACPETIIICRVMQSSNRFFPEWHVTQKARLYYLIYSKLCFTAKKHRHQPCLCLCLGFSQMIMIFPFLLITLHFSQIGFTEALTFILSPPFKKHLASFFLIL